MSLLIFNITSESRALPVPEVDLVTVLARTLLKKGKLILDLQANGFSLSHSKLKLLNSFDECTFVSIVGGTYLRHAVLLSLEAALFFTEHCNTFLESCAKRMLLGCEVAVFLFYVKLTLLEVFE